MKGLMNRRGKRSVALLLAFFMMFTAVAQENIMEVKAAQTVTITESAGYEEGAYAEWAPVEGADGYKAYVSKDGENYSLIDNELIRQYADYWRVDMVGLTAGTYYIKVEAVKVDESTKETNVISSTVTEALSVSNYDRSGFAFSSISRLGSGSGAYNEDGSLKSGAQVVYVTAETAKTCTAIVNGTEQTGIQAILDAKQKANTSSDVLCIRIIGCVNAADVDKFSSSSEGIQIKGKASYTPMNITIEGIGEDATVSGFGFLVRNAGNIEFRNFAIMNFMDDGISLDTDNTNIWIHDMDFFYGSAGGDADQAKGDGTVDMKGDSQYITVSYNHFWDSGKASLCGMKSETGENCITYHHNWFDHSDSRHPRIRTMSVHVYNNYYDGNSKYGVGAAYQSQAFVEANYFDNCKYPMLISKQGSDVATDSTGTFSGEDGGIIKAYNNVVNGAKRLIYANSDAGTGVADAVEFDAYLATSREERVPSTYTAKQGGKVYNNFDTNVDLGVDVEDIDAPEDVPEVVSSKAGRLGGGDFTWDLSAESEDSNYAVISALKTAIVNYKSSVVSIGGIEGVTTSGGTGGDSGSGDESGSTGDGEDDGDNTEPVVPVEGAQIQNFTENGKESAFFNISGNLSDSKGTVTYNGLTLKQCLKMESITNISFTSDKAGTLTLVFKESAKKVKVDGEKYTLETNVLTVDLEAGTHTVTKGDSINLFYMVFEPLSGGDDAAEPTEAPTAEPTVAPTTEPTVVPTQEPTEAPTAEPTVAPTQEPTAAPTAEPTEAPTQEPTAAPTAEPTIVPTAEPTTAPTAEPTAEPTQEPESSVEAFVRRMYTVALGREADVSGVDYWTELLISKESDGAAISAGFLLGEEFVGKNYTDSEYINVLYKTFFGREADEGGEAYWRSILDGGKTRANVLAGFVNSNEFFNLCAEYGISRGYLREDGSAINPGVYRFAERLYSTILERSGDKGGIEHWTVLLDTKACSPENAAMSFFWSEEYLAKQTTDAHYISALYRTFMDREADETGLSYWGSVLSSGIDRQTVLSGFAHSVEFQTIMAEYGL